MAVSIFIFSFVIFIMANAILIIADGWSDVVLISLCVGFIAGSVLYQVAHKSRYGHWFDPPSKPPE